MRPEKYNVPAEMIWRQNSQRPTTTASNSAPVVPLTGIQESNQVLAGRGGPGLGLINSGLLGSIPAPAPLPGGSTRHGTIRAISENKTSPELLLIQRISLTAFAQRCASFPEI